MFKHLFLFRDFRVFRGHFLSRIIQYSEFRQDKGVALFMVLWVLTLLSVIAGEFCYSMQTEVRITRNFKEKLPF